MGIPASLLLLATLCPNDAVGSRQAESTKPSESEPPKTSESQPALTASVKVKVSAEDRSTLPSGSRIEWQGLEGRCGTAIGRKTLDPNGAMTSVTLPVCKVRLTIFITGFDTKAITVDLAANREKYKDPIRITVKHQGLAELDW